jgi:hypothetical protein
MQVGVQLSAKSGQRTRGLPNLLQQALLVHIPLSAFRE